MVRLSFEQRTKLLALLADVSQLDSEPARRTSLTAAGLEQLADKIDLSGATDLAVARTVGFLARYGRVAVDKEALELFLVWVKTETGVEKHALLDELIAHCQRTGTADGESQYRDKLRDIEAQLATSKGAALEKLAAEIEWLLERKEALRTEELARVRELRQAIVEARKSRPPGSTTALTPRRMLIMVGGAAAVTLVLVVSGLGGWNRTPSNQPDAPVPDALVVDAAPDAPPHAPLDAPSGTTDAPVLDESVRRPDGGHASGATACHRAPTGEWLSISRCSMMECPSGQHSITRSPRPSEIHSVGFPASCTAVCQCT
jgi:hypothetical protein